MKTLKKQPVIIAIFCLAIYGAYYCRNYSMPNISMELLENVEALSNDETPDSSWYQYLDYQHTCDKGGLKLNCKQTPSTTHCTYHCGRNIY